ncbi:MAG: type VI secretion system baseplate subunit TssF [Holosporaceae bacterium]|jgi:type VI secretion system protein ImpG|nr:type VI secretion system baseplate subunit TssF [Holosporaceae bacterium]
MPSVIKSDIDILSEYYQYELSYLRSAGSDFAVRFPKIARRLDLSNHESSDPHVERMIESFAFLTGKLQKQIDDQFPEIAAALLNVLYKPLLLPTPSCVMIYFDVDLPRASKSPGLVVPKNTILQATSHSGENCSFRTAHDLQIWPMEILSAVTVQKEHIPGYYARSTYYLKLGMRYLGVSGSPTPEKIRIYLHADALLRGKLLSAVFSSEEMAIYQKDENFEFLSRISSVGLGDDESLLPYPLSVHMGFRLLQEYFSFPEKFYGFDVAIPKSVVPDGEFFIYIPMSNDISMKISRGNFSISSVPAVNLFPKLSEPLRLDNKQVEYCLVSDYRRYHSCEIYQIEKMVAVEAKSNDEILIDEFFCCNHTFGVPANKIFWNSRRKKSYIKDALGEDVYISFVDLDFNPTCPSDKIFYAHTLCTNRYVAEQIPANGALQLEISTPTKKIYCADRPTDQKPSPRSGEILWKLISALSLNSISFGNEGLEKIREILNVFADISNSSIAEEIDAIVSIGSRVTAKRIDHQPWNGFARGSHVEMLFDERLSNNGIPLSMIVAKFLATYASINTFVEVSVKNTVRNGILKTWNHHWGTQNYL